MASICLRELASLLKANCLSGMAETAGIDQRPICARDVVCRALPRWLTQHYDSARTGWNPCERQLTVANVPSLKRLFTQSLDGTAYAQPLYVPGVRVQGGVHNMVYVATENDTVNAFDGDTLHQLWSKHLVPLGESVVSWTDIPGCPNIQPVIGITGTPVIDYSTQTMYVVAKTKVIGTRPAYHYRLHALDITSGTIRASVEISGSVKGTGQPNDSHGNVIFDPYLHLNRAALLLVNQRLYIGFGSNCDIDKGSYHGWVFAYDVPSLKRAGVFCSTPDTPVESADAAAGIWQSGMGLAADTEGFIYFTTGNGDFTANANGRNYGDSVVKLGPALAVIDFFTPAIQATLLPKDWDLGSGGILILPDPVDANLPRTLVTCGKDADIFLLDRRNLGKYSGITTPPPYGTNNVLQSLPLVPGVPIEGDNPPGVWGGPAYYRDLDKKYLYYCGNANAVGCTAACGHMTAFEFSGSTLTPSLIGSNPNQSPEVFPANNVGGATPVVSSNHQTPGTAVLWAITREPVPHLRAYDATDLTHKLFDQPAGVWSNPSGTPMIEPTVINGKVYVASDRVLTVFGL